MSRSVLTDYLDNFYRHGSYIAYVHRRGYRTERWTYRRVAETANRFARELEARQIGKGDRVVVWGENCAEWVAAFYGCALRGAVVVPMDRIAAADFAGRVAQQVSTKLLIRSRELPPLDPSVPTMILEDLAESVSHHDASRYAPAAFTREDPVQIIFTSGTTSEPKGVVISHKNIVANLEPIAVEIEKYRIYGRPFRPIRFLNLVPLSHVFGQFMGLFIPQLLPGTVIFAGTLNPSEAIRTIKKERISVVVTVPRLLESLKDKIERDIEAEGKADGFRKTFDAAKGEHFTKRWWRFRRVHNQFGWKFWAFISGGATLDRETEEFWGRLSFVVIQGYGLTETTSLVSVNHPFRLGKGSIGKVLAGREIKLSETGEILVRGENIAAGYWQDKELKPVEGGDGWFHTGDMGEMDADGNLYFKGRQKNVIVTPAGMKVYPEDLEAALRRQPEVRDCVVFGLEREGNAEACAVLLLRNGEADAAAMVKRANEQLAEFQHMRHWVVWPEDDFPRTSTQKPRTNLIQEFAERKLGASGGAAAPAGPLAELITRVTGRAPANLSAGANLAADLGLSSVDRVELMSALEDRFQIDLNETKFTSATTVGDLEKMLREPAAKKSDMVYPRWTQHGLQNAARVGVYYTFVWPATRLLASPCVRGREHLRDLKGPALFICNHISQNDIGLVQWALPPRFRHRLAVAMEGEQLERMRKPPWEFGFLRRCLERFKWFAIVAWFNVFPMASRSGVRESFAYAGESADRGYNLLVFPEGRRTLDGTMWPFRAGIGVLATRLGLPIVPMRIDGLFEYRKAGKKWTPPGAVRVSIGAPLRCAAGTDPAQITRELESLVASLEWPARDAKS
ncbi:MAG: AMP-binding protein [Acidobacteria bacterium]|nr:AMP-binding protein [Acidobacteriota bacterium]